MNQIARDWSKATACELITSTHILQQDYSLKIKKFVKKELQSLVLSDNPKSGKGVPTVPIFAQRGGGGEV